MSTEVFENWFQLQFIPTVMQHLQCQGLPCKAILLIDNCSALLYEEVLRSNDGKIRAISFPPNTTSVIQPLDGGILETIKRNYLKLLLQHVLKYIHIEKGLLFHIETLYENIFKIKNLFDFRFIFINFTSTTNLICR